MRRTDIRSVLGFLTVALIGASCGGSLTPQADAGPDVPPNVCANVGCAAPPLCSVGCTATCGCCNCAPGERNGDLVCTDQGCFASLTVTDDGGTDGADGVCGLAFDPGPCEAAFPVYAFVNGSCMPRTYGGCPTRATVCALVCDADGGASQCEPSLPFCVQGVCQQAFCI